MYKILFTILLVTFGLTKTFGQNIDLNKYDIYLNDTLISKSNFIKKESTFSEKRLREFVFKPITDGKKKSYYLNGKPCSKGNIKNSKKDGFWEFWYRNGVKARVGNFINGKPNGTHKYWYQSGKLHAIGHWKNGVYDGRWVIYSKDGKKKAIQEYKNGKLIKGKEIVLDKTSNDSTK